MYREFYKKLIQNEPIGVNKEAQQELETIFTHAYTAGSKTGYSCGFEAGFDRGYEYALTVDINSDSFDIQIEEFQKGCGTCPQAGNCGEDEEEDEE